MVRGRQKNRKKLLCCVGNLKTYFRICWKYWWNLEKSCWISSRVSIAYSSWWF